ncbi:non-ribosomal peptide synthetase [Aquimarina pacifica]|uniref:non-ribosomal peptide synthetase n=1 Tax=Aquimarina pacifica TaxID=1296415 RepID=UPI00047260BC|nr:non-ribosomal peptide synthetase [Aquimarina pacifica]
MDGIQVLIKDLRVKGILLNYSNGNLEIQQVDNIDITESDIAVIRANKEDIIRYLKSLMSRTKLESISKVKKADTYPVSSSQRRLWILSQLEDTSSSYNMPYHTTLDEGYDLPVFKKAIEKTIARHEILRTIFVSTDLDEIKQKILTPEALGFKIEEIDYREDSDAETQILEYIEKDSYQPFNLEKGPLLRASLLRRSDTEYEFYFNMHHIISDGWSLKILMNDIITNYKALLNNNEKAIPSLGIQYKDFANWQNINLTSDKSKEDKTFWMETLQGEIATLDLPSTKIRPSLMSHSGYSLGMKIPSEVTNRLQNYCVEKGTSLFMGLLASWNVLLHRYTSQNDIVLGSPVSGREHTELANQIGCYVNTIALRNQICSNSNFDQIIKQIKESTLKAYAHQTYPFDQVIDALEIESNPSRSKLFDILLVFQEEEEMSVAKGKQEGLIIDGGHKKSKLDLEIVCHKGNNEIFLELIYNTDVYEKEMIERVLSHYLVLLEKIIDTPEIGIGNIDYLLPKEREQLQSFNDNDFDYQSDKTILDLYQIQLGKNSDAIAIQYEDRKITFLELDHISSQFANYLTATYSITKNQIVAVRQDRSEWMLISILAILKTGAGYLPIDPEYPQERLNFIKEDSQYILCVDRKEVDNFLEHQKLWDTNFQYKESSPEDLAYVIYTSGSTGVPKGVMNNHSGLYNRLMWMKDDLLITEEDKILQKTPYTFDVSVWELIMPLITGCRLIFAKPEGHKDPIYLQEIIKNTQVTILHFVPSMLSAFLLDVSQEQCSSLKHVVCSGEALSKETVQEFKEKLPTISIHNYYGPTEAAIDVTAIDLTKENIDNGVTIGAPVANTNIYITNDVLREQPIGVVGELIIGGVQVARGYLNREELNKDKFIKSPFKQGEKLYKTGDLARWLPNGTIEFVGRKDSQVKIRGNRIELGEIEKSIQKSNLIKNAVVLVKKNPNNALQLVAYVVANKNFDKDLVQRFLMDQLPSYMVPSIWIELSEMPLTSNGKINRKALPEPNLSLEDRNENVGARNKNESKLIHLWQEVLGVENIGIHDNFFHIGGDSIIAIRLISKINKSFNLCLGVDQLYKNQCIADFSKNITSTEKTSDLKIELYSKVKKSIEQLREEVVTQILDVNNIEDIFPLSDIQRGMMFSSLMNEGKAIYHDQFAYKISRVNVKSFEKALALMIEKHAMLRTGFDLETHNEPIQIVYNNISYSIDYKELSHLLAQEQIEYISEYIHNERKRPFNFSIAPLWRCSIFNLNTDTSVFLFQFHHSILDGWSVASFNTELFQIYSNLEKGIDTKIEPLSYGYKESVIWELAEKRDESNIEFWKQELMDYKRLDIFSEETEKSQYRKLYPKEFLNKLREKSGKDQISLKTVLLGAYVYALKMLTYEDDIVVGLVSNNRPVVEDGDKILGCFLNTLPVRFKLGKYRSSTWLEYLQGLEREQVNLKDKEGLTLFEISKQVPNQSNNENPFFDVLFDFIDFHIYDDIGIDLEQQNNHSSGYVEDLSYEATNTFLDLTLSATGNQLNFDYKLNRKFNSEVSLYKFHGYVDSILQHYLEHDDCVIDNQEILSSKEITNVLLDPSNIIPKHTDTIVDLFTNQVDQTPEKIAIVFGNQKITYQELDELTNQFANYLRSSFSVGSEHLIGVMLERDLWVLVSMLSINKLGAAYVPIDTNFPKERKEYIKKDSQYTCCIDEQKITNFIKNQSSFSKTMAPISIDVNHRTYVIYTSGTTGNPKGVMVSHGNLVSFVDNFQEEFKFLGLNKIALTTNVTFDISVLEILGALCTGKELHLFNMDELLDPIKIMNKLQEQEIEILQVTPSRLAQLYDTKKSFVQSLKVMLVGGEAMDVNMYDRLKQESFQSINVYGPTETTIWSSSLLIKDSPQLSIGKPLRNEHVCILDANNQLQPKGVVGEICIGGAGVTLGYLNKPQLTLEKFISNPYLKDSRLYKTGDLGKWLPDGNLQFLGRKDDQVKIRGYRIELGEIEGALLRYESIDNVIVLAKKVSGKEPQLVAYFHASTSIEVSVIRSFLKDILPIYMIPSYFVQMTTFPLTTSGKIDRKSLPNPKEQAIRRDTAFVAPETAKEKQISELLIEFFRISKISIEDDFFELGGDSLQAMSFINLLNKKTGHEISLVDLYHNPTIKSLAVFLENEEWLSREVETTNEMVI